MSSIIFSLGRVSLVSYCAISSSGPSSSASSWQQPPRRRLSCSPALLTSTTRNILPSTHDSLHSAPETPEVVNLLGTEHSNDEPPQPSIVHGYQRSALQSTLSLVVALAMTIGIQGAPSSRDTFEDVPQTLSGGDKGQRIQKPKSAKAESCTRKCVSTCIRGGAGSGEGPLNVRRPLVVFKEGFRSRQYCLIECSEICNLIGDGDDGPRSEKTFSLEENASSSPIGWEYLESKSEHALFDELEFGFSRWVLHSSSLNSNSPNYVGDELTFSSTSLELVFPYSSDLSAKENEQCAGRARRELSGDSCQPPSFITFQQTLSVSSFTYMD